MIRIDLGQIDHVPASTEERIESLLAAADLAAIVTHRVDFLVDLRYSGSDVIQGNWLALLGQLARRLPKNAGLFVVVGSSAPRLFENVIKTLSRIQPRTALNAVFFNTIEEAEALLAERRTGSQSAHTSSSEH